MTTRLQLVSQVLLEDGAARPLHILRTGSFTDSSGQDVTFTADDMATICARFDGKRKPPITERHDWGRAVGRMTHVWTDGDNLYAQPTWNKYGRELLQEQVYDGFSVELEQDTGWFLIGGSLTNYPAVDGLAPVSLSAPVIDRSDAPGGAPTQEIPMAEEETPTVEETPSPAPVDAAALAQQIAAFNLPKEMAGQIAGMVRESVMAQFATVQAQAEAQTRAEIARFQREQQISTLSQHMTTPTMQRQHALPFEASRLSSFLNGLSETQRTEAIALFDQVLTAGLVSFEEIGNSREGEDQDAPDAVLAEVERVKAAKIASGMAQSAALSAAIAAVGKERYNTAKAAQKKGGR